jgi:predicted RNase H-like nuclease (RuvC/YqgF family)
VVHSPLHHHRVLQAVTQLAQSVLVRKEAVLWCKERVARAADRVAALEPALAELKREMEVAGHGVNVQLVESLSIAMVSLAKVWLRHHV